MVFGKNGYNHSVFFTRKVKGLLLGIWRAGLVLVFAFTFVSCTNYFEKGYRPELLEERKIQATRKFQIIRNDKIDLVVFATYLNDIERTYYKNLEYFFIEIYAPSQEPIIFKRLRINLATHDRKSWLDPQYIRLLNKDEYDEVLRPINKWSNCYLVAFAKSTLIDADKMLLRIAVDEHEERLDYSFKVIPFQAL